MDRATQLAVADAIQSATGVAFTPLNATYRTGGCIHESYLLSDGARSYFVKLNAAENRAMFEAEALGLRALKSASALCVPSVIAHGEHAEHSFLVLEALELTGSASPDQWEHFGRCMAQLHRHTADQFGWPEANFIGATPQTNRWSCNWAQFFRDERLAPQFALAARQGYRLDSSEALLDLVPELLDGHEPVASLLHGDLWSGNAAFLADGRPVIYDPASYYGDRETDLAFSKLFGGFPESFYSGYSSAWPLPTHNPSRDALYNLYHVLNHLNLFGTSYVMQAKQLIGKCLS